VCTFGRRASGLRLHNECQLLRRLARTQLMVSPDDVGFQLLDRALKSQLNVIDMHVHPWGPALALGSHALLAHQLGDRLQVNNGDAAAASTGGCIDRRSHMTFSQPAEWAQASSCLSAV